MVSQKLLALTTLLYIIKVYRVHAQCQVDYTNQPCTASQMLPTASYIQPVSQYVIPAVIQPVPTDPYMGVVPPSVPDYSKFYNPSPPVGGMPAIIFDSSNDNDGLDNLLYILLFALRNKRNNASRRNYNNGGCSCRNSYSANGCNCSNCNNCGGCGTPCDCSNNNSGYNNCYCANCGNRGGCEKCSTCGKCGSSGNTGGSDSGSGSNGGGSVNQSINGFPCGSNCIFIPFPIAVPIGNAFQCNNGSGCPIHGIDSFVGCDDCQITNGQCPNEINLIIRAADC